jgi:hypothetical protein
VRKRNLFSRGLVLKFLAMMNERGARSLFCLLSALWQNEKIKRTRVFGCLMFSQPFGTSLLAFSASIHLHHRNLLIPFSLEQMKINKAAELNQKFKLKLKLALSIL